MYVSVKRSDGELKLLSPRGRVLDVLRVFRLLDVIPSFEDETNALASFQPRTCSATRGSQVQPGTAELKRDLFSRVLG